MKGFKLVNGDINIEGGKIRFIEGNELIKQTVQSVLGTNNREWFLNENEGIDFRKILIKNPNYDVIRSEIIKGLKQVDESFEILDYENILNGRSLYIKFTAINSSNEKIEGGYTYAE